MNTDLDTKLAEIQARGELDFAKIAREIHCDTSAAFLDHPSDYLLRKDRSRSESILRKHFAHARADLRFCLQTIAELRAKIESHEKANVHNQGDSQRVSNPANGDSSQGASSDGYAAWLVENGKKQGEGLKYLTMGYAGMFTWTESPYEAIHFCRRLDAEKVSAECEDAWLIVEHWFAIDAARGKEKV